MILQISLCNTFLYLYLYCSMCTRVIGQKQKLWTFSTFRVASNDSHFVISSGSSVECARVCLNQNCHAFTFNPKRNKCQIYAKQLTNNVNDITLSGWTSVTHRKDNRVCPNNWIRNKNNCYFFSKQMKEWQEAEDSCKSLGGHLAKIDNEEENEWIKTKLNNYTWIGLNDVASEGNWQWVFDDSAVIFTDWIPGAPNNGRIAQCGIYYKTLRWDDMACSIKALYICEN